MGRIRKKKHPVLPSPSPSSSSSSDDDTAPAPPPPSSSRAPPEPPSAPQPPRPSKPTFSLEQEDEEEEGNDDESDSEEEEGSSSESQGLPPLPKKPPATPTPPPKNPPVASPPPAKKPTPVNPPPPKPTAQAADTTESDSDTASEPEPPPRPAGAPEKPKKHKRKRKAPDAPPPLPKPVVQPSNTVSDSDTASEPEKPKKREHKRKAPDVPPPPPKSAAQPSVTTSEPEPEKSKKHEHKSKAPDMPTDEPNGNSFKKGIMRVWTDEDIIVLLNGLVEFRERHGHEPSCGPDHQTLLDLVKKRLHSEFNISQITSKSRGLKKKYAGNLAKEKDVFSSEHDKLVYNLSRKIWGNLKASKGEGVGDDNEEEDRKGANGRSQRSDSVAASPMKKKTGNSGATHNMPNGRDVVNGHGDDPRGSNWAVKLIMQDFVDGGTKERGMIEHVLTIMDPEVLSSYGEKCRELNRDEFSVAMRRYNLKAEITRDVQRLLKRAGF